MKHHGVFLVFVFAVSLMASQQAMGQECQICATKQFYEQGETVVITGRVDALLADTPMLIQIFNPLQNLVEVAQVDVAQDGSFTHRIVADGTYFRTSGEYIIRGTYGISSNVYESTFEYQTKDIAGGTADTFEVRQPGTSGTFDIPYTIRGGTVTNMFVDPNMLALIVQIQSVNDGTLILDLERQWIDSRRSADGCSGGDDSYIIQIDGIQVPYQEAPTTQESRVITIQFQEGDSDIEIIGTCVIPEFGPIAIIILVISITSMIFVSAKKGLPRF